MQGIMIGIKIEVNDCFAFVRVVEWLLGGLDDSKKSFAD
jgi:hypothetical protein